MIRQSFLQVEEGFCCVVEHIPDVHRATLILFSGFGQTKCEYAFFYSRLAKWMSQRGILTIQWDYRGHGDSSHQLEDITWHHLQNDACALMASVVREYGHQPLYLLGKGIGYTLASQMANAFPVNGALAFYPHVPRPGHVDVLLQTLGMANEPVLNLADALAAFKGFDSQLTPDEQRTLMYFQNLGGYPENLKGQQVQAHFLRELDALAPDNVPCPVLLLAGHNDLMRDAREEMMRQVQGEYQVRAFASGPTHYLSADGLDNVILAVSSCLEEELYGQTFETSQQLAP
jgi:pimeloyl-ACP methyl ester carboxylesterase